MTNEKLIAVLKTAQKEIVTPQAYTMLEDTIATLRKEIAVKTAKSAGKQDLYKAMMAVIKSSEKHSPNKRALHGAWFDHGKQYVCNGYMLIENSGTPLDLPALPDDAKPMNVHPILKARAEKEYPDILRCPTIAELKSGIAEQKALAKCNGHKLNKVLYYLGGGHVANAEYLRTALQATGNNTIQAENRIAGYDKENKRGYQVGELWFESEDGTVRVLVLPVRGRSSDDFTGFKYGE